MGDASAMRDRAAATREQGKRGAAGLTSLARSGATTATIDCSAVRDLFTQGLGASEIARRLKIGHVSVYRVLEQVASWPAEYPI